MVSTVLFFALVEALLAVPAFLLGRDAEPVRRAATGDFHVVVLGDSFSFGIYVDPADSYPSQLRRTLSRDHGLAWRFTNAALPGNSPLMVHRDLDATLAESGRPDLVLLLAGFNVNDGDIQQFLEATGRGIPGLRGRARRASAALERFRSFRLLRQLVLRMPRPWDAAAYTATTDMELFDFSLYQEVNRWALDHLVGDLRGRGIEVVLLNYPQAPVPPNAAGEDVEYYYAIFMSGRRPLRPDDYLVTPRSGEMAINAVIGAVARKHGVPLVDNFLRFHLAPVPKRYFLRGDEHPNARGYALMAAEVLAVLERVGLVGPRLAPPG